MGRISPNSLTVDLNHSFVGDDARAYLVVVDVGAGDGLGSRLAKHSVSPPDQLLCLNQSRPVMSNGLSNHDFGYA